MYGTEPAAGLTPDAARHPLATHVERGPGGEDSEALAQRIRALPKVELHLHLEGSIRRGTVQELAAKHEPQSPLARPDWYEHHWTFTDLAGFIREMRQVTLACLREPEDYYRLATECFADLAAQQVLYAEVSFGLRLHDWAAAPVEQARREAEAAYPLRIGLVVGMDRLRPEAALPLVRAAIQARERGAGIVGIDLVGDEAAGQDFNALAPAMRRGPARMNRLWSTCERSRSR